MAVMQALHGKWLPRITSEILASRGRCAYGAVSPDREVSQKTFVREEQYLIFVKVELEVVGNHLAECMWMESKVIKERKAMLSVLYHGLKRFRVVGVKV